MVELTLDPIGAVFASLADPTRRDILRRVARKVLSINEIAEPYELTVAAVSKHVKILEKAKLVTKRRIGKQQVVTLSPTAIKDAGAFLKTYEKMWNDRLDSLEDYLSTLQK